MIELINLGKPMRLIPNKLDQVVANRAITDEVAVLNERCRSFKIKRVAANNFCRSFEAECIS